MSKPLSIRSYVYYCTTIKTTITSADDALPGLGGYLVHVGRSAFDSIAEIPVCYVSFEPVYGERSDIWES